MDSAVAISVPASTPTAKAHSSRRRVMRLRKPNGVSGGRSVIDYGLAMPARIRL